PELPADRLVRLAGRCADGDDRRARLLGERGPLHIGLDEDERPRRSVDRLAVELEPRAPLEHEVELLVAVARIRVRLVVLVQDAVADLPPRPGSDAERRDAEVMANGPIRFPPVVDLLHLVETRDAVVVHRVPSSDLRRGWLEDASDGRAEDGSAGRQREPDV